MTRWALLVAFAPIACESYVATDGREFAADTSHSTRNVWTEALTASASHDLACPPTDVRIIRNYRREAYLARSPITGEYTAYPESAPLAVVDACGQRATYTSEDGKVVLVSRRSSQ